MELQHFEDYKTPPKRAQLTTPPKKCLEALGSQNDFFETPTKNMFSKNESTKSNRFNPEMKLIDSPVISPFYFNRINQDYIFIKQLGNGNFSNVGQYESRLTSEKVAIKVAKTSSMSMNEVQALGALTILAEECINMIRYFYSWTENGYLYLVMENCDSSLKDLFEDYKSSNKHFAEAKVKEIMRQALKALACLHRYEMVHLDVKPQNLLLLNDVLKLSDLGLARSRKIKKQSQLQEGDARYLALEVLNYHEGIDLTKADMFSLGMTIYEGITHAVLPNNGQQWTEIRKYGLHLHDNMDLTNYSSALLDILQRMTDPNWKLRPSAQDLLSSKFFKHTSLRRPNIFRSDQKSQKNHENSL